MLQMSVLKKGTRIEGDIIYRDTYSIKPVSYHGTASKSDQYGCLLCGKYKTGQLRFLGDHQQKSEGRN